MKIGNQIPIFVPEKPIELPEGVAALVNITDQPFSAERTHGMYRICGSGKCKCDPSDDGRCQQGDGYIMRLVGARRGVIDKGDRKPGKMIGTEQFVIKAEDIAQDLVREWNSDLWGIGSTPTGEVAGEQAHGFAGVFVADGAEPTEEELDLARQLLAASDAALTERAHSEWDQFKSPQTIHSGWKRAARRMGIDAEWLYTVSNRAALPDCPFCGSKLKTRSATVCATCHRDIPKDMPQNGPERQAEGDSSSGKAKGRTARKTAAA